MTDITDDTSKWHALCLYCDKKCGDHDKKVKANLASMGIAYYCVDFRTKN